MNEFQTAQNPQMGVHLDLTNSQCLELVVCDACGTWTETTIQLVQAHNDVKSTIDRSFTKLQRNARQIHPSIHSFIHPFIHSSIDIFNQSINQSIDQSITQSVSQSVSQSMRIDFKSGP
jgi:hypothetical protein